MPLTWLCENQTVLFTNKTLLHFLKASLVFLSLQTSITLLIILISSLQTYCWRRNAAAYLLLNLTPPFPLPLIVYAPTASDSLVFIHFGTLVFLNAAVLAQKSR